jgi:hypothetical protein
VDLIAIRAALTAWVMSQTDLSSVLWENERRPFVTHTWAMLNIITSSSNGVDETRYDYDPGAPMGEELQPYQAGVRRLTLSCQVESHSQLAGENGRFYLERLRARWRRASSLDQLSAAGLAVVRLEPTVLTDYIRDDHMISRASMDVVFALSLDERALATATPPSALDDPTGYIAIVEVTSNLEHPDGSAVPEPPDFTAEMP